MTCPHCGGTNFSFARKCDHCGQPLASSEKRESAPASVEVWQAVASPTMAAAFRLTNNEQAISRTHNQDLQSIAIEAGQLQKAGRWEQAFAHWRILTAAKPERATSWGMCGLILQQATEAGVDRLFVSDVTSGLSQGQDAWQEGMRRQLPHDNLRLAVAYLNRALEIDSNFEMAWYVKAHCLCSVGLAAVDRRTLQRGLDCFNQAMRIKDDGRTRNDRQKFVTALERME